jgi:alpha-tubulin suppressor-like RCC1 family protein
MGLRGVVEVALGGGFACARFARGHAECWDWGAFWLLPKKKPFLRAVAGLEGVPITALGTAESQMCGLTDAGKVLCWHFQLGFAGSGARAFEKRFKGPAVAIASGRHHSCVIVTGGRVWCSGINTGGELGNGKQTVDGSPVHLVALPKVRQLTCSDNHCCALDLEGSLWCWGGNEHGEFGPPFDRPTAHSIPIKLAGLRNAAEIATGRAMALGRESSSSAV